MKNMTCSKALLLFMLIWQFGIQARAQVKNPLDTVTSGIFDMGKMWTFDYPPVSYFSTTYNFKPDTAWFNKVRLSALRFSNYCSASFVSPNGLVMTNHHCARESGTSVQKPGENFSENGFYAIKLVDERKVPDLYVDQLVKIENITSLVQQYMATDTLKSGLIERRDSAFKKITSVYKMKNGWKNLELEPIAFYNGAKYALYGYKRYTDVRLVFMPEKIIGFFGGNYDNFTYPRYDLDCSFFRVYDEYGNALKTENYFKFNPNEIEENEPVFVVGNPGRTNRLFTVADLEFQRDLLMPNILTVLKNRIQILEVYNKKANNDVIANRTFVLENSHKAITGRLDGLKDPYLMARKAAFEKKFQNDLKNKDNLSDQTIIWKNIRDDNDEARKLYKINFFFTPNPVMTGNLLAFAYRLQDYVIQKRSNPAQADDLKKALEELASVKVMDIEEGYLAFYLKELVNNFGNDDPFVIQALHGRTSQEAAHLMLQSTKLNDPRVRAELLNKDTTFINQFNDPLLNLARIASPIYRLAYDKYTAIQDRLFDNRSKLGNLLFKLYATSIPPDATSSLRINDGVVKGYPYNGTIAPVKTTFYGMYNRYYSFFKQYPWNLPKRWENPSDKLLPIALDFVTTNDIVGGNSGSPIINKNREIVGLAFDGNMESLPGYFIYMPDVNRCIGVTATGMLGALKYIYKAKRLEKELLGAQE